MDDADSSAPQMEAMAGSRRAGSTKDCDVLPQLTLMLLGKTGSGKSSLGNAILGLSGDYSFPVTGGFCATAVYSALSKEAEVHGRLVKVVDTPGLMDISSGGKRKALKGICDGISHCSEGVDAFLIVLRLDGRLTDEEWRAADMLEELFGEQFWNHAIVVFTHGDSIDNDSSKFERQLDAATTQMPLMRRLKWRLETKPALVDASKRSQKNVVADQMAKLLLAVDRLVRLRGGKKYDGGVFDAVRQRSDQELQKASLLRRELTQQLEQQQGTEVNDATRLQRTIQDLKLEIESIECEMRHVRSKYAAEAMEEASSRGCSIL